MRWSYWLSAAFALGHFYICPGEADKKELKLLVLLPHWFHGPEKLPFGAELCGAAGKSLNPDSDPDPDPYPAAGPVSHLTLTLTLTLRRGR